MTVEPALRVRDLRKTYNSVVAVDALDLDIAAGEIVGLLGHNGAGKSTLISSVAGLRRPDSGTITVAGIDAHRDPVGARRRLGLAPQETGIYPDASVRDNLRVFGALAGLRRRRLGAAIEEASAAFGLDGLMHRPAGELSGGQRRRVHTAAAVLHRPPLLLLDEPTVGADMATRDALLELVRDLAREGAGVCYSTHYLPASTAAALLTRLPWDALARLDSLELVRDDLDSAYRTLTEGADAQPSGDTGDHAEVAA